MEDPKSYLRQVTKGLANFSFAARLPAWEANSPGTGSQKDLVIRLSIPHASLTG
jgi:hypothetical protein